MKVARRPLHRPAAAWVAPAARPSAGVVPGAIPAAHWDRRGARWRRWGRRAAAAGPRPRVGHSAAPLTYQEAAPAVATARCRAGLRPALATGDSASAAGDRAAAPALLPRHRGPAAAERREGSCRVDAAGDRRK